MGKESSESKVSGTIDAVTGLVKAIPVYEDAVQPAAKELGRSLETVAKAVNVVLAPISGLVWGYDQIKNFVNTRVAEKLKDVPEERIQQPNPTVAGPALEALKYTGHEESLREMYANLLATSIDSATARNAHPGFVEILKNFSPDEARIMKLFAGNSTFPIINLRSDLKNGQGGNDIIFHHSHIGLAAGCEHSDLTPNYLNNLCRLGLLEIPDGKHIAVDGVYDSLENDDLTKRTSEQINRFDDRGAKIVRGFARITILGKQFSFACVIDRSNAGVEQSR